MTSDVASGAAGGPLVTPDGRYIVVRGRLWRRTDPGLTGERREELVRALMSARRAKKDARAGDDPAAVEAARLRVDAAKTGLGERGPVWWDDDAPDETRRMARNTRYAEWFAGATEQGEDSGGDPDPSEHRAATAGD